MIYDRDLTKAEQQNITDLERLQTEYDSMTRLQRIRHLGIAVDLSNRIARIEGLLRERRRMYDFPRPNDRETLTDDSATDTLVSSVENE